MSKPPETPLRPSRFTPGLLAWLRRFAGVPSRKAQVWSSVEAHYFSKDRMGTLVVVGAPELAMGSKQYNNAIVKLTANVHAATSRAGWCHEVFCLETNSKFHVNECWFANSELGLPNSFKRVA